MDIFGPEYLLYLSSTLETALQRGYQVHVRINTLAYVLNGMQAKLEPGIVSPLLEKTIESIMLEIFSDFSKEKKVQAILKKTPEAKRESGFHVLRLLAGAVAKEDLLGLVEPFVVPRAHGEQSHETLQKCRKATQSVSKGLEDNTHMSMREKLTMAYGMLHGKLGQTMETTNR